VYAVGPEACSRLPRDLPRLPWRRHRLGLQPVQWPLSKAGRRRRAAARRRRGARAYDGVTLARREYASTHDGRVTPGVVVAQIDPSTAKTPRVLRRRRLWRELETLTIQGSRFHDVLGRLILTCAWILCIPSTGASGLAALQRRTTCRGRGGRTTHTPSHGSGQSSQGVWLPYRQLRGADRPARSRGRERRKRIRERA
jgi:hypothetical protein